MMSTLSDICVCCTTDILKCMGCKPLASCRKHHTDLLFTPILLNAQFMQPLNVGDHWITVTNVFSTGSNEVQLYDSTVPQYSSLLRLHKQKDSLTFNVHNYAQQTGGTRISGYYAMASMMALCEGLDISAHMFDENILMQELGVFHLF